MNCQCGGSTKVLDTRLGTYRRRECLVCGTRFHTVEQRMDGVPPAPYHAPREARPPSIPRAKKPKTVKKIAPVQEKKRRAEVRARIEDLAERRSAYDEYDYLPEV